MLEVGHASRRSAAIELTTSNLERMRGLLRSEIAAAATALHYPDSAASRKARRTHSAEQKPDTSAKRTPRGTPGAREYFDQGKSRWVRKVMKKGGPDRRRRYKVLLRRPTDEATPAAVEVPKCQDSASGGDEEAGLEQDDAACRGL